MLGYTLGQFHAYVVRAQRRERAALRRALFVAALSRPERADVLDAVLNDLDH